MFEKLKEMIVEQVGISPDSITVDSSFEEDLGLDSLDLVELSMALEAEYNIGEMTEEEVAGIKTVGDLMNYLQSKLDA